VSRLSGRHVLLIASVVNTYERKSSGERSLGQRGLSAQRYRAATGWEAQDLLVS